MKTERTNRSGLHVQEEQDRKVKRSHARRPVYKITAFSPKGKVLVRLNSKTEAWVTPGTDIDALKKHLKIS